MSDLRPLEPQYDILTLQHKTEQISKWIFLVTVGSHFRTTEVLSEQLQSNLATDDRP